MLRADINGKFFAMLGGYMGMGSYRIFSRSILIVAKSIGFPIYQLIGAA